MRKFTLKHETPEENSIITRRGPNTFLDVKGIRIENKTSFVKLIKYINAQFVGM